MCVYIHADSLTCSPYYLFVPPSFCSADCGSGQGNGKGQVTLLHPLLALPSLQHVCGEERGGRGGRKLSHYNQAAKTELHLRVRVLELTCVYLSVCYQVVIYIFFYFPQRLCFCSIIQTHGWWCVEGGGGRCRWFSLLVLACWQRPKGEKWCVCTKQSSKMGLTASLRQAAYIQYLYWSQHYPRKDWIAGSILCV